MNILESLDVIDDWKFFARKKKHAQHLAEMYRKLGDECSKLLDELEAAQPPMDTTRMIPVMEHKRVLDENYKLKAELQDLQDKLMRYNSPGKTPGAKS